MTRKLHCTGESCVQNALCARKADNFLSQKEKLKQNKNIRSYTLWKCMWLTIRKNSKGRWKLRCEIMIDIFYHKYKWSSYTDTIHKIEVVTTK